MGTRTRAPEELRLLRLNNGFDNGPPDPAQQRGDDSADNVVLACRPCNTSRGEKGIFEWLGLKEKDKVHGLVAGKYLKQLLTLHERTGTLEISKDEVTILCKICSLPRVCEQWDTVRELTYFCLESILVRLGLEGTRVRKSERVLGLQHRN